MRVDFVITELYAGGAERCLTELAIGMANAGDHVRVFSLWSLPPDSSSHLVQKLVSAGIEVETGRFDSPVSFVPVHRHLRRWLGDSKPDLCQTFLHHANVFGTIAAKSAGVPIRIGGVRVAEVRRLRCRVERFAVNRMTGLVCVSARVQKFAEEYLGCDHDRSIVIPNGVDVGRFEHAEPIDWTSMGWSRDAQVTLFVGRLHPQKGLELLQQEIDQIAPDDSNRKLMIVGDGPLQGELQSWANRIGQNRVQLMPWQANIEPWIAGCQLLVLPSHYEGMPNVILEAMAAARPVVCSRVEGTEELLGHSRDQQTFNTGDGPAMARLVEAFLLDSERCRQTGLNNQSLVRSEFSIPAMVDAYRSHYRTLLARRLDVI